MSSMKSLPNQRSQWFSQTHCFEWELPWVLRIEWHFEFCFLQMNIYSTWLISIGLPPTPVEPACAETVIWEMIFIDILAVMQVRILVMWFNLAWTFPDFKKCSVSLESNKWLSFWGTLGSQGYFKTVVGFLISFQTEKTAGVDPGEDFHLWF